MDHHQSDVAPPVPKLLTLKAAARYSGLNEWHLRDLVRSGELAHVRVPSARMSSGRTRAGNRPVRIIAPAGDSKPLRRYYIAAADLDALVARHRSGVLS